MARGRGGHRLHIPSIAYPDGASWRLRPKGTEYRLEDHDQRGQERRWEADEPASYSSYRGSGGEATSSSSYRGSGGEAPQESNFSPSPLQRGGGRGEGYVELHLHSCYSFREGASTPRELVARAAALGYQALAITDRDGLYGAMEFARAAEAVGVRPIIGADVTLQGGYRLVLLAETREGYANLCRLISNARLVEGTIETSARPGVTGRRSPVDHMSPGKNGAPGLVLRHRSNSLRNTTVDTPQVGVRPEIPNPQVTFTDLARHAAGLIALSGDECGEVPSLSGPLTGMERALAAARRYMEWFGPDNFFIELQQTLTPGDTERNRRLVEVARELGLGVVATNDVWYHVRERHRLHDVLVAIKHRSTLDASHRVRHANSERYLKSVEELTELFEAWPEAIANTRVIAERCRFDLVRGLGYEFPSYPVREGETPDSHLAMICWQALERKYPDPKEEEGAEGGGDAIQPHSTLDPSRLRPEAEARLEEELALIKKHGLAGFFLAYYDLLLLAGDVAGELKGRDPSLPPDVRPVGRGRGSSVSSIVCYLIGLSHIDPIANELFLGRFLNDELPSVPDIDLDFPRDVREQILKRVWTEFEGGRAALICGFSTYRGRGAIRDVGKALGLPALELDHLAKLSDAWPAGQAANPNAAFVPSPGLDPESGEWLAPGGSGGSGPLIAEELARVPEFKAKRDAPLWRDLAVMAQQILGLPRHVTQHVGGVVLSAKPMQEYVPLEPTRMEGRVMCQWDKDSVDDARMVKIDFLALGMLSLVDECLDTIEQRHGMRPDLGRIVHDDPEVFDQICASDTIGTFQIESRAQISTLAHTQPRNLDDLAVQVAIVRPGPIVGGAFKPYMEYRRRLRAGEPVGVKYIHPCLEPVLKDTLGVVLYQEQVVQVAMAVAGYTAGQADLLRRNLNRRRGAELAEQDWPVFLARARERGIPDEATEAAFQSILGFAAYGFPKSHAVAFGLLAYESTWLRHYYPAEYYAALFNNQPMGFYSTEVIAGDARRHGIEIVRPDINQSGAGCTVEDVEGASRVRLGLGQVKSVGATHAAAIVAEREAHGAISSVAECAGRLSLSPEALENLVLSGAFDGGGRHRRELLWELGLIRTRYADAGAAMARSLTRGQSPRTPGAPGQTLRTSGRAERQILLPLSVEQDMVTLPPMTAWEAVAAEYETLGLSPSHQAMALLRPALIEAEERPVLPLLTSAEVERLPDGTNVRMAGLVTCRQRPSTAKGVVFVSLEDEYGLANVVVYADRFDRQRTLLVTQPFLIVRGRVQRQGSVVHIIADHFECPQIQTTQLISISRDFH